MDIDNNKGNIRVNKNQMKKRNNIRIIDMNQIKDDPDFLSSEDLTFDVY